MRSGIPAVPFLQRPGTLFQILVYSCLFPISNSIVMRAGNGPGNGEALDGAGKARDMGATILNPKVPNQRLRETFQPLIS